jgi:hypothetical protein
VNPQFGKAVKAEWQADKGEWFSWGDTLTPPTPSKSLLGFHVTSIHMQDRDGVAIWRLPTSDTYQTVLIVEGVLVPGATHEPIDSIKRKLVDYLSGLAKNGLKIAPPAYLSAWSLHVKNLPRVFLYASVTFSGLEFHKGKSPAVFFCNVCDQLYTQLVNFLWPRLQPEWDWAGDKEVHIVQPPPTEMAEPIVFNGKLLVFDEQKEYNALQSAQMEKLCP